MSSAAKSSVSINENIFFFSPAPLIMQSVMLKKGCGEIYFAYIPN